MKPTKELEKLRLFMLAMRDVTARKAFAKRCKTTVGQLANVYRAQRTPNITLAISLDRETSGQLRMEKLRPDIDWKYLRATLAARAEEAKAVK